MKNIKILLLTLSLLFTTVAQAKVSPVSLGIVPPIQFPTDDFSITGIRISALWGHHRDMYGLDFGGLGNITDQDFVGLGVAGLFNNTRGQTKIVGLQLAGLANINTNKTNIYGLQLALVNYNSAETKVVGFQVAAANLSPFTDVMGVQFGVYNRAKEVHGLQIGLVNATDNLHGLQIGLINYNKTGMFVVSPILNAGF